MGRIVPAWENARGVWSRFAVLRDSGSADVEAGNQEKSVISRIQQIFICATPRLDLGVVHGWRHLLFFKAQMNMDTTPAIVCSKS